MEKRSRPILSIYCPDCNAAFMGSIMDEHTFTDEDFCKEIIGYAHEGFQFKIVNAADFSFGECKCSKQTK